MKKSGFWAIDAKTTQTSDTHLVKYPTYLLGPIQEGREGVAYVLIPN